LLKGGGVGVSGLLEDREILPGAGRPCNCHENSG
jgi:hypothetical protein